MFEKVVELMKETIYDILRSLNIEKNNFTQEEWIDFINELENNVEGWTDEIPMQIMSSQCYRRREAQKVCNMFETSKGNCRKTVTLLGVFCREPVTIGKAIWKELFFSKSTE